MTEFSAKTLNALFAALPTDAPLAIAVSGGGDSMALLHLALNWRGGPQGLVALTVDHALRDGSAAEARQVKAWCNDLGLEHHTLKWRHGLITSGLQAKARAARYGLLTAWCAKHGITALLTAHTIEDQAETVAMRKKRTKSPRALAAIWPKAEMAGISVCRPLLGLKRAKLRAYLKAQHQDWLEDPSNQNPAFERVRVRQKPPATRLARTAAAAQRQVIAIDHKAAQWCARHLEVSALGLISFARTAFMRLRAEVADAVLTRLIDLAGGQPADAARRAALISWLKSEDAAPRRTLGGALFAKRKRVILVAREPARIDATAVNLKPGKSVVWDGRFEVRGPAGSSIVCGSAYNALTKNNKIPAFLREGWPLVLRRGKLLASPLQQNHAEAKIAFIKK